MKYCKNCIHYFGNSAFFPAQGGFFDGECYGELRNSTNDCLDPPCYEEDKPVYFPSIEA